MKIHIKKSKLLKRKVKIIGKYIVFVNIVDVYRGANLFILKISVPQIKS